jgi:hypothetical protein
VVQSAVVSQGDGAGLVDLVVADAAVGVDGGPCGGGLGSGGVGLPGGPAVQGPVRPDVVVVAAEPGELAVQAGDGLGRWLRGEPLLLGLLEAFVKRPLCTAARIGRTERNQMRTVVDGAGLGASRWAGE